jgi:superfamily II DNA or RNA helicase
MIDSDPQSPNELRVYYDIATAAGKTKIIAKILASAKKHINGNKMLITANLQLKRQMEGDLYHLLDKEPWVIISSEQNNYSSTIAFDNDKIKEGENFIMINQKSFNDLVEKSNGDLSHTSIIIVDEFHKMDPRTQEHLKQLALKTRLIIIGFSATPNIHDDVFKHRLLTFSTEDGIAKGYIAPWVARRIHIDQKYIKEELPTILNNTIHPLGGTLNSPLRHGIIYFPNYTIEELKNMEDKLKQNKINAYAYHSRLTIDEKNKIISDFSNDNGNTQILLAINCLHEGFNSPNVDFVFVISEKSPDVTTLIQMRGRALRKYENNPIEKIALFLTTFDMKKNKHNHEFYEK